MLPFKAHTIFLTSVNYISIEKFEYKENNLDDFSFIWVNILSLFTIASVLVYFVLKFKNKDE